MNPRFPLVVGVEAEPLGPIDDDGDLEKGATDAVGLFSEFRSANGFKNFDDEDGDEMTSFDGFATTLLTVAEVTVLTLWAFWEKRPAVIGLFLICAAADILIGDRS